MKKSGKLKVAFVYDRINKWGGAERLLLSLGKVFPKATLYTLVHHKPTSKWASGFKIVPSFFNRFTFLQNHHEILAPLSPYGFESFNFDDFDIVISVTSENAKAIITRGKTLHICLCLTPTRYLWSSADEYQLNPGLGAYSVLATEILDKYKQWFRDRDFRLSQRPNYYLAISREVQKRIKQYYKRESDVIYPPIKYKFWSLKSKIQDLRSRGYYLVVSRLVPYKRVDLVIKAFSAKELQGRTLKVVGTGSQLDYLKSIAGKNVQFLGHVDDKHLREFYGGAHALIFPQTEDFGLVPLEAQAAGTPVIAFRGGGAIETIIENQTGVFFDHKTIKSLSHAISEFEINSSRFMPVNCRRQAKRFDESIFLRKFSAKVDSLYETYRHSRGARQKNLAPK